MGTDIRGFPFFLCRGSGCRLGEDFLFDFFSLFSNSYIPIIIIVFTCRLLSARAVSSLPIVVSEALCVVSIDLVWPHDHRPPSSSVQRLALDNPLPRSLLEPQRSLAAHKDKDHLDETKDQLSLLLLESIQAKPPTSHHHLHLPSTLRHEVMTTYSKLTLTCPFRLLPTRHHRPASSLSPRFPFHPHSDLSPTEPSSTLGISFSEYVLPRQIRLATSSDWSSRIWTV